MNYFDLLVCKAILSFVNIPNWITVLRVPLLFAIAGASFSNFSWLSSVAFFLVAVGALSDWLDGFLARKYNLISKFGKLMDALSDKIMVSGCFVILLSTGVLSGWAGTAGILIILTREFWVTGLRALAAADGVVLAAEKWGKIKTVFQFASLHFLFLGEALLHDFSVSNEIFGFFNTIGLYCFWLSTGLTIFSGIQYGRKYSYLMFSKS